MPKLNQSLCSASQLHTQVLNAKNNHDLIKVLSRFISTVGGWSNAPKEVLKKLK